jgi:hypothetical protein
LLIFLASIWWPQFRSHFAAPQQAAELLSDIAPDVTGEMW